MRRRDRPEIAIASFLAGAAAMGLIWLWAELARDAQLSRRSASAAVESAGRAVDPNHDAGPELPAPAELTRRTPSLSADPVDELRQRDLIIPVANVAPADLQRSFDEPRGSSRRHEALDILAPRHTPVLAVEDGIVARLFASEAGGITIYQFDPSRRYVYYYAHLQRYASGLQEGAAVARGDTIGYVGTTGNAPPQTPHLHLAIFRLSDEDRWWEGTPANPFDVLVATDQ